MTDESATPDPERVKNMTEIADRIINELGRGRMEIDVCNACLLVIQLVCERSESTTLGESTAGPLHMLAQHILKHSVARQVLLQARPEPPMPDFRTGGKKPYLN